MAVTINGTTGITTPSLTADTTTLVVDETNNRVGVGTASPARALEIAGNNNGGAKANYIRITDTDTSATLNNQQGGIEFYTSDSGNENVTASIENLYAGSGAGSNLTFNTAGSGSAGISEAMRIDSSGNLLINNTVAGAKLYVESDVDSTGIGINALKSVNTNYYYMIFRANSTTTGEIYSNGTSTTYSSLSDYRLKENVVDMTGAIDRVKALKPSQFNFIVDPDNTVDGFLAHEVQAVVPEAVSGFKDEVDGNGNPKYQGIDQSKLVPLLTGALKEAIAEIESLKARVDALEAN